MLFSTHSGTFHSAVMCTLKLKHLSICGKTRSRNSQTFLRGCGNLYARGIITLLISFMAFDYANTSSEGDSLLLIKDKWKASLPTWISNTDPCGTWEGVTCNQQGQVSTLNLTNKGLIGPVPDEVNNLLSLTVLDLSNQNGRSGPWNEITGDLSPIGSLINLQNLNLSFNNLVTQFPSAVLQLTNLVTLKIDSTHLTGPFPAGLSKLTKLKYLWLGNNSMTGSLPSELGSMVNLVELTLWSNPFNSRIPVEFAYLTNLRYLNLHNCSLWGGLPPEFGRLESMQKLHLYRNQLTGTIPDSWQNMTNLQEMEVQYNFLTKTFPSWILHHANLQQVDLHSNQFYGPFPNLSNTNLRIVLLECNFFNGSRPIPQPNMVLHYQGNCFSNITSSNDNSKWNCHQIYTCNGFTQALSGGCPLCPADQFFLDRINCVCGLELEKYSESNSSSVGRVIGIIAAVIVLLFIGCLACYKWRMKKKISASRIGRFFSVRELSEYWEAPKGVQKFTFQELARATSNFHKDQEIGVGGFGRVYLGTLDNGKKVAIKRASPLSLQGSSEFHNEVLLLSRLHHRNLVHLEGFCEDSGFQILVYEYMTNGNLHRCLFDNKSGDTLSWSQRLDIAVGIARGLEYLHSFADPPVIHRDVKPSNILLDNHLVAKVADFGLSKTTLEFETHISTTPAGTAGYIDPQYFLRRQLTTSSDVYAFGVVLLELVTGQRAIEANFLEDQNLVEWVKSKLNAEEIQSVLDPQLGINYPADVLYQVTQLALRCAAFNTEERPPMQEVVSTLEIHVRELEQPACDLFWPLDKSLEGQAAEGQHRGRYSDSSSSSSGVATRQRSMFSDSTTVMIRNESLHGDAQISFS